MPFSLGTSDISAHQKHHPQLFKWEVGVTGESETGVGKEGGGEEWIRELLIEI